MNPDTLWLVRLGIEQGLFTRVQAVSARARMGGKLGMVDFAQKLIDEDIVTNVAALEKLAGIAALNSKKGPPKPDPFIAADDLVEDIVPMAPKKVVAGPAPVFAFEDIDMMDDKPLGAALQVLLADCVSYGASDLHLCTGRRPFVRKDRVISYISEHPLTEDSSLRINTVLLSPCRKRPSSRSTTSTTPWPSACPSATA